MRKYIIGFLVGILAASAVPAYGAVSSIIGKKVQNEFVVYVDGKQLEKKAVVIDGFSYSPVRAIAESIGYDIAFANGNVYMSDPSMEGAEAIVTEPQPSPDNTSSVAIPTTESPVVTHSIADVDRNIRTTELAITFIKHNITNLEKLDPLEFPNAPKQLEDIKISLSEKEAELEKWKSIKAELEAQVTPTP